VYVSCSSGRLEDPQKYLMLPFQDLKIALSGFPRPDRRVHIAEMIIKNGGKFSPDLDEHCTHLVLHVRFLSLLLFFLPVNSFFLRRLFGL
jgi:hypothetical protein